MNLSRGPAGQVAVIALVCISSVALIPSSWPAPPTAAGPRCDGWVATVVGSSGDDRLVGTQGPDVIVSLSGDDKIFGRGGRDVLCGGDGRDRLHGGPGADRLLGGQDRVFIVEVKGDSLWGGPGNDYLRPGWDPRRRGAGPDDVGVPDLLMFNAASRGVRVDVQQGLATGEGHDVFTTPRVGVVGSRYGDQVSGWDGPDYVSTGRGPDVVRTHDGPDRVFLDIIPPSVEGPIDRSRDEAPDTAATGPGWDFVVSWKGRDEISGGAGRDWLSDSGRGSDVIRGGPGGDWLRHPMVFRTSGLLLAGGSGPDEVFLNLPRLGLKPGDVTTFDLRSGVLEHVPQVGPAVTHTLSGFSDATMWGTWGTLTLYGTDEANVLRFFGAHRVSIFALAGDDILGHWLSTSGPGSTFDGGDGIDGLWQADCAANTCISIENLL